MLFELSILQIILKNVSYYYFILLLLIGTTDIFKYSK